MLCFQQQYYEGIFPSWPGEGRHHKIHAAFLPLKKYAAHFLIPTASEP